MSEAPNPIGPAWPRVPTTLEVETPHELVISGPGGLTQEEALNLVAKQFPLRRRGQHVWMDVPARRGLEPIYAFAKSQGLRVLDAVRDGATYHVKCVDTP